MLHVVTSAAWLAADFTAAGVAVNEIATSPVHNAATTGWKRADTRRIVSM